ncbi:MAG TPA: acyl-CoA desaturase [Gemmatimonadales bacterium]|nr:acyl-CoA desaturase [Gemmatimonadales bacterium]
MISFPNRDASGFAEEVKQRIAAYFESRGISRHATAGMVVKTIALLAIFFVPYGLILSNRIAPLGMLGLAVVMGIGLAGIGFAISHDALHGAYSGNPRINSLLGRSFDLLGANGYMWKITHNVIHHTYTNIDGVDEDLTVSPLLRLSPGAPLRRVHRFQHLYGFATYMMSTLFWVFIKDFKYFLARNIGPYQNKKHPRGEVVNLILSKLFYCAWAIVIPLLVLQVAWWQFAIGFVLMHVTAGFILGVIFQLAHVVEGTEYPVPDGQGRIDEAWLVHEMTTTADFARRSRLLSWYVGGLNFQIEHHLFPRVCSVHYPALSPIVQAVARKHGMPYHDQPTLWAAVRSHYRMLKRLGRDAWREQGIRGSGNQGIRDLAKQEATPLIL